MRQSVADVAQWCWVGGGRGGSDAVGREGARSADAHTRAHAQEQLVGKNGGQMLSAALQRTRR